VPPYLIELVSSVIWWVAKRAAGLVVIRNPVIGNSP
jgi:hypothetical protein